MQELIYKNAVLRNGDLRKRVCNRAILEFCSLLGMNLADMQVEDGGRFLGNGWERCNLFGMALKGVTVEMDRFQGCSMGSTDFQDVRLEDVRFCDCSFSGSVWTETVLEGGVFQNCIFRGMGFVNVHFHRTVFQRCILDGCRMEETEMKKVRFRGCALQDVEGLPREGTGFQDCSF